MKQTPSLQWLTRSNFFKLGASVVGATAGAYILYEVAPWMDGKSTARRNREPLVSATGGGPPIRELIRYATLAANGHNAQAWQFMIEGNAIQIHLDLKRRLPAVDPNEREMWISLGCALENMCIAARNEGFEPEITYPGENDHIQVTMNRKGRVGGDLFEAITRRQNTRSEYDGQMLGAGEVKRLISVPLEPGISVIAFEGPTETERLLEYVNQGNISQFEDESFVSELNHWIRYDKREMLASRDGLSSLCTGNPQVPRWLGEMFLHRMTPAQQADSDAKKLRSSAGAFAIASTTDDKAAWVRTGQVYQRLALTMTNANVRSAFLNQPIEVKELRGQFQAACGFGDALPQLLLRFGRGAEMPFSSRRSVEDVIVAA